MVKSSSESQPVSGDNPCPFLRALVSQGQLPDGTAPLQRVARVVVKAAHQGEGHPVLPHGVVVGIAAIANGVGPLALLRTWRRGLRLNRLRGGPLDKKGVGSGILDSNGQVDRKQLMRLREFAEAKTDVQGRVEPGLGLPELQDFMDANFARAAGRRRRIDRALMDGEWPVLLKVMGRDGPGGRYLSVREVEDLFTLRRLPQRMRER